MSVFQDHHFSGQKSACGRTAEPPRFSQGTDRSQGTDKVTRNRQQGQKEIKKTTTGKNKQPKSQQIKNSQSQSNSHKVKQSKWRF